MEKRFNIQRQSLSHQVYVNLKSMILSGIIEQGERIPEEKIASKFQVSRTPIREAIKRLSDYGLVEMKPRSYSYVIKLSNEEANQIAEIRVHLEKLAVKLFTKRASINEYIHLEKLASVCETLLEENDRAGAFEKDSEFHLTLMKGSGNKFLYEMYEKLDSRIQLLRLNQKVPKSDLFPYMYQHNTLIQLLKNNEYEKAESIMEQHSFHHLEGNFSVIK